MYFYAGAISQSNLVFTIDVKSGNVLNSKAGNISDVNQVITGSSYESIFNAVYVYGYRGGAGIVYKFGLPNLDLLV